MKRYLEQLQLNFFASARREILGVAGRILVGIIFAGVSLYSLISIGQQLNSLLLAREDGPYLSITLFTTVLIVCIFALYFLIVSQPDVPKLNSNSENVDLERVFISFYKGIIEGLNKNDENAARRKQSENSTSENIL